MPSHRVVVATGYEPILKHLASALGGAGHELVGVMTVTGAPPVVEAARSLGLPCFTLPMQPGELNIARATRRDPAYFDAVRGAVGGLSGLDADVLVGWAINVLPSWIVDATRHAINVHPSDLPRYRGGFPLEAQILDGQRVLYVTVHETEPRIDSGAVLARSEALKIKRSDTMTSLLHRALPVGARLVADTLSRWGSLQPVPPTLVEPTLPTAWGMQRGPGAHGRTVNLGVLGRLRIEWELDTAEDISRAARAFDMVGGAYTDLDGAMYRITRARTVRPGRFGAVGDVLAVREGAVEVQALDGVVQVEGAFTEEHAAIVVGDRFESVTPIAKLVQFEGAERVDRPGLPTVPAVG